MNVGVSAEALQRGYGGAYDKQPATLVALDGGSTRVLSMSVLYPDASGTRKSECILTRHEFRRMSRLRGPIKKHLRRWRAETKKTREEIRLHRAASPSKHSWSTVEHREWMRMEAAIAAKVWGIQLRQIKQRIRFERFRARESAVDRAVNLVFPEGGAGSASSDASSDARNSSGRRVFKPPWKRHNYRGRGLWGEGAVVSVTMKSHDKFHRSPRA